MKPLVYACASYFSIFFIEANVEKFHATYDNAMEEIGRLRDKFGGSTLFGNEKDDSFKSSIDQIYQTFGGDELYPSVEEKAAMLLYLVCKIRGTFIRVYT